MKLTIIAAGKVKEKWLLEGISEYRKRLSRYCEVDLIEVADSPDDLPRELASFSRERQCLCLGDGSRR